MKALIGMPYEAAVRMVLASLERNLLPDAVVRRLTRLLLANRLRSGYLPYADLQLARLLDFKRCMPIAVEIDKANSQHYELPTSFFKLVLGKNLKYSLTVPSVVTIVLYFITLISCYFQDKSCTLEDAENAMLELYCENAQVKDGQSILDLGCGWGSLSIYIAKKYQNCSITGICNSTMQKAYIEEQCRDLQLFNVEIIGADISNLEMEATFDRIISIEMFEHMKNDKELLKKISKWMKQDSLLFIHHFCHKTFPYHFEVHLLQAHALSQNFLLDDMFVLSDDMKLKEMDKNEDDWITRYFFAGGTMPSVNLLLYFQDDVTIVNHWLANGTHYARTSEEWLKRMDQSLSSIRPIFETTYGNYATKWIAYRWTLFIAGAELFGYSDG